MINNKLFLPYNGIQILYMYIYIYIYIYNDSNFKTQLHFLLPALKFFKCLKTSTIRELRETSQSRNSN